VIPEPEILIDRVSKRFAGVREADGARGPRPALDAVSLSVARGEIVVVVGPSGCGKSTTLRLVAGLDDPDEGTITIAGRAMQGVAPQDRDVAMVFQGYALYPQMTVRQILEFPLRMRKAAASARSQAVAEAAAMLRIEGLLDRRPGELSGGERQRVAMGRAIVRKPRVFLFDEPLSNLDASLRGDLRLEIGRLVRRLGVTALYVTHDHVEAMTLGDRIAVMRAGRIVQLGTPREIYETPATSFVGAFLGSPRMNLIAARVEGDALLAGPFRMPKPRGPLPQRLEVGVRPEHVRCVPDGRPGEVSGGEPGEIKRGEPGEIKRGEPGEIKRGEPGEIECGQPGEVDAVEPLGAETHLVVRVGELELRARARQGDDETPRRGDAVRVVIDLKHAFVFSGEDGGERIA
jgi:multiple sugar transport system ATP-binding protein